MKSGEPYLFFVDTANKHLPFALQQKGLRIHHSNLCTEIMLPTNKDRTAVCCLSSINLVKIDEWEPVAEQFIDDLITMLDNVLDVFIETAPEEMWRAYASAHAERSLGLGTLGFHTMLQNKRLAMSDPEARELNRNIFRNLQKYAVKATERLAEERGEPEDMAGTRRRNAHLIAIAPNSTTSIVCNASPSIEPMAANAFTQKTMGGFHEVRNPALQDVLFMHGKDTPEVWKSIVTNSGSVQHLDFLSPREKLVFQTAEETDNKAMLQLASDRQPYICQGQSINLFFPPDVSKQELSKTHFAAWKMGLKSLYYLRSSSVGKTGTGECKACEA
jgi:ribonucleoside-diphosphate reductase alpha chain